MLRYIWWRFSFDYLDISLFRHSTWIWVGTKLKWAKVGVYSLYLVHNYNWEWSEMLLWLRRKVIEGALLLVARGNRKHPTHEARGKVWNFFYHRCRTESLTVLFFKSRQPDSTPYGIKSLSLSIFWSIKIRKTGEGRGFKQFGKKIINLHTKLEEYILA